jgi:hypothetical protein
MSIKWLGNIVNTAKRAITVVIQGSSKVIGVVGKEVNTAIKIFIRIEPVAVTAIAFISPGAAAIVAAAYKIAEHVEAVVTDGSISKLQMATGLLGDTVIPIIESGITGTGHTVDATAISAIAPDLFSAIVEEANAQASVAAVISAVTSGSPIDRVALAQAESAVAVAVAKVKILGMDIAAVVNSIKSVTPEHPA